VRSSMLLVALSLLFVTQLVMRFSDWCNMTYRLQTLLIYTATQLQAAGISFWIDDGTLLGAYRDGALIPHDFDVDIGVMEQECEKVLALRETFARANYRMYGRGEYIAVKARFGGNGYLLTPCVRIYDASNLHADIQWWRLVPESKLPSVQVPLDYNASRDGPVICTHDGHENDPNEPGNCRGVHSVFPLSTIQMGDRIYPIPRDTPRQLVAFYGADWHIPRARSVKVLCRLQTDLALRLVGAALLAVFLYAVYQQRIAR